MSAAVQDCIIIGPVVHSISREEVEFLENAAVIVKNGKIVRVEKDGGRVSGGRRLGRGQFLCPGLVDLHIHAPQYPNVGLGSDLPLLQWLSKYTFPLEAKYSDLELADTVYRYAIQSSVGCGSTTACYYGTLHTKSTVRLAELLSEMGQRAIVGKVNMNQNSPNNYTEKTAESVQATSDFVKSVLNLKNPLVQPAVTPRFAIACDMELMKNLAAIASDHDLYIQTHISENKSEVEFAQHLFPSATDYTDIYDKAGLLTDKTILGHGVYLSERELGILSARGTAVAHCPNSNTYLKSGLCDVRRLLNHRVKVGLGTDVSGGTSPSILDAMRNTLQTSIHISFNNEDYQPLNYKEAFYLATLGGATALGMEDKIGNFTEGKEFDAIVVDMKPGEGSAGVFPFNNFEELFQKFIYCGDSRNIKEVYVNGSLIKSEES